MERSTQCKDAKQEYQRSSNTSYSNNTKETSGRLELQRKNSGENQLMTPRYRSKEFPSLKG
jgi:hypothetical protein